LSPHFAQLARFLGLFSRLEGDEIVLQNFLYNLAVMTAVFFVFLVVGTFLFVRGEQNR
jgi:hypothetical protein